MILEHRGKAPKIDDTAVVAPNATVCGDVTIGPGARILFGAVIVAEGGSVRIEAGSIVMENAVVRSTPTHDSVIGRHVVIGPHANLTGCEIGDGSFIGAGASVFNGACVGARSTVRVHAVVHLESVLPPETGVPIGWIAIGNPAQLFPPHAQKEIADVMVRLEFAHAAYKVASSLEDGETVMGELTSRLGEDLAHHKDDKKVG